MSSSSDFERTMLARLKVQFGDEHGQAVYARYTNTKEALKPIWEGIPRVEQDLTDHGPGHIENVLKNVHQLLGESIDTLTGIELYCLGVSVLFHDCGNLKGRTEHQQKVGEIYDSVRSAENYNFQEKLLVMRIVAAHAGFARDGSVDTLTSLGSTPSQLEGESVRVQSIAAILRFADELAEGRQRTSIYMLNRNMYSTGSLIFHRYASITNVHIDRGSNRIALQYNVPVKIIDGKITSDELSNRTEIGYNQA